MAHHNKTDYGTGEKKLSIYVLGILGCAFLTLISFWAVMTQDFSKTATFIIIYSSACIQFLVQLVCFLRLNTQTDAARTNVMAIIFTGVILVTIIVGSMWIMSNLNYNMMN